MMSLSFHYCNLPKEIISASKRIQMFQHATAKNNRMSGLTNIAKTTASALTNGDTPKPTKVDITLKDLTMEELLDDGRVYEHLFFFKSYELGLDNKATLVSITNKLQTRLSDLDMNKHINNAAYVNFIIETAPKWLLESHYVSGITLKYLKECGRDEELQCLCAPSKDNINGNEDIFHLHHSLRLQSLELTRGTTIWSPKL
ncbi:palmitoyl-acyl carrier protein thioesterase, chloroplastic-like [Momordica charantia]|uniref:Palmitoyl-acyl carrier protein thioesterase, chloroplastic-like n=1 Tax=Momordica charantia TaxID=3673 RepID=A0A6J1DT17_MOMCH|nr:palmitoyl-acyl carrier protein thioesterase, chloroplastic-like [Momordica charantia]